MPVSSARARSNTMEIGLLSPSCPSRSGVPSDEGDPWVCTWAAATRSLS